MVFGHSLAFFNPNSLSKATTASRLVALSITSSSRICSSIGTSTCDSAAAGELSGAGTANSDTGGGGSILTSSGGLISETGVGLPFTGFSFVGETAGAGSVRGVTPAIRSRICWGKWK